MNELSLQDNDTKAKIRTLFLNGKNILEIQNELGISSGTWDNYYYLNKYGLRDFMLDCKKEKTMAVCQKFSDELLSIESENNAKMKAIQQKEAEFLRETLLKDTYSKRIETIGFNVNKNEPLDDEQKARLDKLTSKRPSKVVEYTTVDTPSSTGTEEVATSSDTTEE